MHETLSFESTAAETVMQETAENQPSHVDPELDDSELYELVSRNASVIVKLNGAEMTLSEAMYQIPINRDNISNVIALVYDLLANQEEEQPEEEKDETETEIEAKAEKQKPAEQKRIEPMQKPRAIEKQSELKTNKAEDKSEQRLAEKPTITLQQRILKQPYAKRADKDLQVEPAVIAPPIPAAERPAQKIDVKRNAPLEPTIIIQADKNRSIQSPGDRQPVVAAETAETIAAPIHINKTKPADIPPPIAKEAENDLPQGPKDIPNSGAADQELAAGELESVPQLLDPIEAAAEDPAPLEDVSVALLEDEEDIPQPYVLEGESDLADYKESSDDFFPTEEELILEPAPEVLADVLKPAQEISIPHLVYEQPTAEPLEIIEPENMAVKDLDNVGSVLVRLDQIIGADVPEELKPLDEILNQIVKIPAKLDNAEGQANVTEAEIEEEIEELFTGLLDEANVEYTPELIEDLTVITLKWILIAKAGKIDGRSEPDAVSADVGTNEVIKQLLISLNNVKKYTNRAGAIGKSAIWLYSLSLAA